MSDPISVLLVIGAAVVGPIEAQPTCVRWQTAPHGGSGTFEAPCISTQGLESLPQLCERLLAPFHIEKRYIATYPDGVMQGSFVDGLKYDGSDQHLTSVRCIPTPKGYRK